ncbi:SRPBCC family protein [Kordiimonas aquimaris]|uniref:SRPBCC family protein n=1 Tax=Kordiimonas aquimaris TaxID=707591 RepID=UPI0021D283F6|nr:SRPBCC domain-containing protein [Kordiimonas aquimaris]
MAFYQKLLLVMASLLFCLSAKADETNLRTIETSTHIAATPDRVLKAFYATDDLAAWWLVSRSLTSSQKGNLWSIVWENYGQDKTHHVWSGVVSESSSHRLVISDLVMIEPERPLFGPMQLEIIALADGDGTRLTVLHHGYQYGEHWNWSHKTVVGGWEKALAELAAWFEEGAPH